jgi:hypothetical protein
VELRPVTGRLASLSAAGDTTLEDLAYDFDASDRVTSIRIGGQGSRRVA